MSQAGMERFIELVLRNNLLRDKLLGISDYTVFLSSAVQLGEELGCSVTEEDVRAAMQVNQRAWIERFVCS